MPLPAMPRHFRALLHPNSANNTMLHADNVVRGLSAVYTHTRYAMSCLEFFASSNALMLRILLKWGIGFVLFDVVITSSHISYA